MPDRLEIHSATIEFEDGDENDISVGGYIVFDSVAGVVRFVNLTYSKCERWIETFGHNYPEPEDDDLS